MKPLHAPILFSIEDSIATLTLNRAQVLNAIDLEMGQHLHKRLLEIKHDPAIRAVIITGSGRGFCAGGDLRFAQAANPDLPGDSFLALTDILHAAILEIREMSKPIIAAINGPAAGAGFFLALACDLRVMAESAYLKQSNTSYGLSLPAGGSFTLPRLVGMTRALEIVMLDEAIPAPQALELGLVSKVAPDGELWDAAQALAQRVAHMPVGTLGRVKRLLNQAFVTSLEDQLEDERQVLGISANFPEGREGVAAFLEKRPPNFVGNAA